MNILLEKLKSSIMNNWQRKLIIFSICIAVIFMISLINFVIEFKRNNIDTMYAIRGIVMADNAEYYKKPKESRWQRIAKLDAGENAYIVDEITTEDNKEWYKIKAGKKVGYILKDNVDYYEMNQTDEYVLMADVSKFNVKKDFKTKEDFEYFLLKHDFNYVYIRAGGRGYGKDGNFYTDPNYKMFIEACDYLGIPYGFYYIDEALNSEEIDEEVQFMYDFILKNATINNVLPLVIDIEKYEDNIKARTKDIWEDRKFLAAELVDKFNSKGISSIIYTNANIANEYLSEVNTCFWLAYYDGEKKVPSKWYSELEDQAPTENEVLMNKMVAWQFSESGAGKEIDYKVDLNLVKNNFFIEYVKKYKR